MSEVAITPAFDIKKMKDLINKLNTYRDAYYNHNQMLLINSMIYSREAIIITVSIIIMNILIVLGVVNYENKLLKKYLVT